MMAGGIQVGGNAIQLKDNGILLAEATDPCCCCDPTVCCPDGSPATYTVSLSGVTMVPECLQCTPNGTDNGRGGVTAGNVNGTYSLTASGLDFVGIGDLVNGTRTFPLTQASDCSWAATAAVDPTTHFYWFGLAQNCTDPLIVTTTGVTLLLVHRGCGSTGASAESAGPNHFDLHAFAEGSGTVTDYTGHSGTVYVCWEFFKASFAAAACKSGLPGSLANADTTGTCGGNFFPFSHDGSFSGVFGTGGTAAISTP